MFATIRKHPVASYFALTFLLSWGGIFAVIGGGAIPAPPEEADRLFVLVYLAMLAGPSIAGIAVTAIAGGMPGLAEFRARLLKWRVEPRWYAAALLIAPLALLAALAILSPLSDRFVPGVIKGLGGDAPFHSDSRTWFVLTGLLIGLGAGFFEELGWTGFALPRLCARYGVAIGALLLGLVWGAWHFLAIFWGGASAFDSVPIAAYLAVALFSFIPPYRVLMAYVYDRTKSLFIAILMHASLTASMLILGPAVSGTQLLAFDITFAALFWLAAGLTLGVLQRPMRRNAASHRISATPTR
ncbi:MAG TPA: CPBP family intramembrane glutamic endopeptidase [Gemmatimonadaceae bacterium]